MQINWGYAGLLGGLTLVAIMNSRFHRFSLGPCKLYSGAVLLTIFAVGEELSQIFIPSRAFDFFDLAADSLGILLAAGSSFILHKRLANFNV